MSLFNELETVTATIASGQSLSAQVNLGDKQLVAIVMPSGWDAADLTFQASADGGTTWGELFATDGLAADAVAAIQIHLPAASLYIAIDPDQLRAINCLKVRSGTSGAPVNQTAGRALTLVIRGVM